MKNQEDWEKNYRRITQCVIEICEDIAKKGEGTAYQEIFDMIFEQVQDKKLHIDDSYGDDFHD